MAGVFGRRVSRRFLRCCLCNPLHSPPPPQRLHGDLIVVRVRSAAVVHTRSVAFGLGGKERCWCLSGRGETTALCLRRSSTFGGKSWYNIAHPLPFRNRFFCQVSPVREKALGRNNNRFTRIIRATKRLFCLKSEACDTRATRTSSAEYFVLKKFFFYRQDSRCSEDLQLERGCSPCNSRASARR